MINKNLKFEYGLLDELKKRSISTTYIRQNKLISESTLQNIRMGKGITLNSLMAFADLMNMSLYEIIRYVKVVDNDNN